MKSLCCLYLVCILATLTNQVEINSIPTLKIKERQSLMNMLKGDSTDCNSTTATMLKKVVEDAALYNGNNVFANIEYILDKINSPYTKNWDVAIMTNANVTSSFSKFVTPTSHCMLISTKFNFYSPSWAYMFRSWVTYGNQAIQTSSKASSGGVFSADELKTMKNVIDRISIQHPDDIQEQAQQISSTLKKIINGEIEVMVTKDYVKTYAILSTDQGVWFTYPNKNVNLNYIVYARE